MTEKFCRDCGSSRPIAEFARNGASRDGLAFYCRQHARLRSRASRDRRTGPPTTRVARDIEVPAGSKWCPDCGLIKPLNEFPRTRAAGSGRHSYCLPCHNARGKASKDKVGGSRTYHLKRRYGISAEEADLMLAEQSGICAICEAAAAVHVDHDHATGAVRQMLCFNCNGGLGQFKDDPDVLRAAAEYVERHRELQSDPTAPRRPGGSSRAGGHSPGFVRWLAMQASGPPARR